MHLFYLFFFTLLFLPSFSLFSIIIVKEINSFTLFTSNSFPTHLCLSLKLRQTTCIFPFSHLLRLYQFLIFKFLKMKHIYSKSAFKKYRQPRGGSSTHYQKWTETLTGPSISRPNPPSNFTMRSDDSIIEIEDPEPCSSSSFHSGAPWELPTLSISTESPSPRSLNRDWAPTIPYAIPSWSYHHSLQIG